MKRNWSIIIRPTMRPQRLKRAMRQGYKPTQADGKPIDMERAALRHRWGVVRQTRRWLALARDLDGPYPDPAKAPPRAIDQFATRIVSIGLEALPGHEIVRFGDVSQERR